MKANNAGPALIPGREERSRLRRGLLISLSVFVLSLALAVSGEAGEIGLFFAEGVTNQDRAVGRQAIAATIKYFQTNYNLHLNLNVKIVLTRGDKSFGSALKRYCVLSPKGAEVIAKRDIGYQCEKDGAENILIKMEDNNTKAETIILVSHEIVHKFQKQESPNFQNIHWLSEGVADVLGANVAEAAGVGQVCRDRQNICLKQLKAKKKFPSLSILHSKQQWDAAGVNYGINQQYLTAELAVFELAKLKGYKSLFQYFRNLRRYNNAQAFEMAFRMKLVDYEKYFHQWLARKL